jgi:DNA-binding transcriptional ArsR family regulator
MGLVRRKVEGGGVEEGQGALHRIMMEAFLKEPLGRWDAKSLCEVTGLSQTGIHHQMIKLRECGLISSNTDGGWHIHVLRGGSISSALELVTNEARTVLKLRMRELSDSIIESEERMSVISSEETLPFKIMISEPGPISEEDSHLTSLTKDLGLSGERVRSGDSLASNILIELCTISDPITILALSDKMGETRSRVGRSVDKMRVAGIVERVPMMNRIAQDIFIGVMRQFDARGEEWLMTRGGLGRLDDSISESLISGAKSKSLSIDKVEEILLDVDLDSQKILLNTLGGRMPYGFRVSGKDGGMVTENVMRSADRTLRRLKTVSQRLEEAISF